jgi:hypothetical protein
MTRVANYFTTFKLKFPAWQEQGCFWISKASRLQYDHCWGGRVVVTLIFTSYLPSLYFVSALVGIALNSFMVATWMLSGKKNFDAMPIQLKACVFFGILCGLVDTIPSAALKVYIIHTRAHMYIYTHIDTTIHIANNHPRHHRPCHQYHHVSIINITNTALMSPLSLLHAMPALHTLQTDVACGDCGTEECMGDSVLCSLSRSSQFLLLAILVSLASLTWDLNQSIQSSGTYETNVNRNKAAMAVPIVLMTIGYALDSADNADTNNVELEIGVLNAARQAFTCSMRLPNLAAEWLLLGIPTILAGLVIVFQTVQTWKELSRMNSMVVARGSSDSGSMSSLKRLSNSNAQERRLLRIALMAAILLLLNLGLSAYLAGVISDWYV